MKKFLEEYGFAILAAIVVILLIAMSTPVGNLIKNQTMSLVNKFSNTTERRLAAESGEISVILTDNYDLIITSPSKTDKFKYIVHYQDNGADKQTEELNYEDGFIIPIMDKETTFWVEVIDVGTNKHYVSNTQKSSSGPIVKVNVGDIIKIDGWEYFVLASKGNNQYLLLDRNGIGKKQFNVDRNGQDPTKCGIINDIWKYDTCNNQYENSNIDVELNETYYNSLSFKNAIVEQQIQQNFYQHTWSNPNHKFVFKDDMNYSGCNNTSCVKQSDGTWVRWDKHTPIKGEAGSLKFRNKGSQHQSGLQANIIKRKIFLPSIAEVSSVVNIEDQYAMDNFLRDSGNHYIHMWFRDGRYENNHSGAMTSDHANRSLNNEAVYNNLITARPAFVVDLSNIHYER